MSVCVMDGETMHVTEAHRLVGPNGLSQNDYEECGYKFLASACSCCEFAEQGRVMHCAAFADYLEEAICFLIFTPSTQSYSISLKIVKNQVSLL